MINPGATTPTWVIKVVSLREYNVYNVQQVKIGLPGTTPAPTGGTDTQAVNLAESFTAAGSVAAGTCAIMGRVGDKNVFYAAP